MGKSGKLLTGYPEKANCIICFSKCTRVFKSIADSTAEKDIYYIYECPRCGNYRATNTFIGICENSGHKKPMGEPQGRRRANLSGWIRENQNTDILLTSDTFKQGVYDPAGELVRNLPTPSFHQKADKLILAMEAETIHAADVVEFQHREKEWVAKAWAYHEDELWYLTSFLRSVERVSGTPTPFKENQFAFLQIDPSGWAHIEKLKEQSPKNDQGFVAMPFTPDLLPLYKDAFEPAIWIAGYRPLRIDRTDHVNRIDDQIELEIRNSNFIIADLTCQNPGVYYEAGLTRGLGIPVIWTCLQDEMDAKKVHFDARQFNVLPWSKLDDLVEFTKRLSFRIQNTVGKGPLPVPPELLPKYKEKYPKLFKDI